MTPEPAKSKHRSNRFIALKEEESALLEAVLRNEFRSFAEAARGAGLADETLRSLLDGEDCYRSTLYNLLAALRWKVDPQDLKAGNVPRVQVVLDRPPASRDIPRIVHDFLDMPFFYHEMARLLLVHPERLQYLERTEKVEVASQLSAVAGTYNTKGLYTDASRAYIASAGMYGLAGSYDDELTCSAQSLITAWTFGMSDLGIEDAFQRQQRLVTSRLELSPSVVGNAAAGLACGTFHFADDITSKLIKLALMLLPKDSRNWSGFVVDPLLATRRRDAHLLGRQQRDAGVGTLKDIMAESEAGECAQGSGNTAMCIACLLEEELSESKAKGARNRLIRFLTDPKNHFQDASTWVRSFSGFGLGRLYLAQGKTAKGGELIKRHVEQIRLHGFTPGLPMATRNKTFFSPEPLNDQERSIFGPCAFRTRQQFPIPDAQLLRFLAAAEDRFGLHCN